MKKTNNTVFSVVLCGGSGTRLWPISRSSYPKQFLSLYNDNSLFQNTLTRLNKFPFIKSNLIISNYDQRFLILDQLSQIDKLDYELILEPISRNTSCSLTLAALRALEDDKEAVLIISPSDHFLDMDSECITSFEKAIKTALNDEIVVLGVKPNNPSTDYGYIELEKDENCPNNVSRFIEKPNILVAKKLLNKNNIYWNSGIFVMKAKIWLKAIRLFNNEVFVNTSKSWNKSFRDFEFIRVGKFDYFFNPSISIDYAVLEKCPGTNISISMKLLKSKWDDLGSWSSLYKNKNKDASNNAIDGNVLSVDNKNCFFYSNSRLIAASGVNNLVVIETKDSVLVGDLKKPHLIKKIFNNLKDKSYKELDNTFQHNRPWGTFFNIDHGFNFKVKKIVVNPGKSLSLQLHRKRAEHWVVVQGNALIQKDQSIIELKENESTYIPSGVKHRLINNSKDSLVIIEIQTGDYLEEDDIVRYIDDFGRV